MRAVLILMSATALLLCGCATIMTGMVTPSLEGAPLVLAYSGPEVIRDQARVATLVVPASYGVSVDGVPVRDRDGAFNPKLRVAPGSNTSVYLVDVLPGEHTLTVTYNALQPGDSNPELKSGARMGSATVTASYSGPSPFSWIRTSDTAHTLNPGDVYTVALKLMTITGEMDLYSMGESGRNRITASRKAAHFPDASQPADPSPR
ncbi:hypothetical protein IHV25_05495 [Phaeovibrio sulfidiphilus]|uniref:Uncharacterized protein n=1 Tax=Phaeovibrio sulfidiphilus TaxID=1220600 RepID=A0A8J7CDK7_9PROT|nr:hypothetical protein [Phaeovibrio sulfidiphilus]MBE1237099.1 hypothetical protein [Phaeovibrio sulfidiphilus]